MQTPNPVRPDLAPGDRPLYRWEQAAVLLLLLLVVGFGALTLVRSAYLTTRKTDYGVYARAAWADSSRSRSLVPRPGDGPAAAAADFAGPLPACAVPE